MGLIERVKDAWNLFRNKDPTKYINETIGPSFGYRPDRRRFTRGNERSIVTSVYNRIALDAASVTIQHVQADEDGRFLKVIHSGLHECLNVEANVDQTGRAFMQDVVMSMLDEGCVALVPIDTDDEPNDSGSFRIYTMRTGRVLDWYPEHVRVEVYDQAEGRRRDIIVPKSTVAIVENPLYAVINEPNSTLQRLIRKLNLLDAVDEQSGSGKLDLIIQLPYLIKTEARRAQAEQRRHDIEQQLSGSKFGIAYTDGSERVTQLNRPVENNLMDQIEYLTTMLYSQLGITQAILDGTADDRAMLNYYNRTIEPILSAITDEMARKFLTRAARARGQTIAFYRDPFKLAPLNDLAATADTLTRNEIMTANEIRQIIGMRPSNDPNADELRNKNMPAASDSTPMATPTASEPIEDTGQQTGNAQPEEEENQNGDEL